MFFVVVHSFHRRLKRTEKKQPKNEFKKAIMATIWINKMKPKLCVIELWDHEWYAADTHTQTFSHSLCHLFGLCVRFVSVCVYDTYSERIILSSGCCGIASIALSSITSQNESWNCVENRASGVENQPATFLFITCSHQSTQSYIDR